MSDLPVTETPITDAAIRGYLHGSSTEGNIKWARPYIVAGLRAALPWDLPAERVEVMAAAMIGDMFADHELPVADDIWYRYLDTAIAAYRADPIMRELYPEKFR